MDSDDRPNEAKEPLIREGTGHSRSTNKNDKISIPSMQQQSQQPSLNQVIALLSIYLGLGTLMFFLVRDQIAGKKTNGILDSVYFSVVTMTTVGYGDLVPNTAVAKLLACVYVFAGTALVGLILGKAADYVLDKQEALLVRALHARESGHVDEAHRVEYRFIAASVHVAVFVIGGTLFLCFIEGLGFVDSFYCVCSTITTLGYGDQSFSTGIGRAFAVVWIIGSTVGLAQVFLYIAEIWTEKRRKFLVKWVVNRKFTSVDLEAADLDHDTAVSAAEFVVYKLKEMGKIKEEDISLLMETFVRLDLDRSGTLTASDLLPSQSY